MHVEIVWLIRMPAKDYPISQSDSLRTAAPSPWVKNLTDGKGRGCTQANKVIPRSAREGKKTRHMIQLTFRLNVWWKICIQVASIVMKKTGTAVTSFLSRGFPSNRGRFFNEIVAYQEYCFVGLNATCDFFAVICPPTNKPHKLQLSVEQWRFSKH